MMTKVYPQLRFPLSVAVVVVEDDVAIVAVVVDQEPISLSNFRVV